MTSIQIILDGDNCWPDLRELPEGKLLEAQITGVALLPDAEVVDGFTGQPRRVPGLTLRIALPDGCIGLAQIKLEMWDAVSRAMTGRLEYLAAQRAAGKGDA